MKGNQNDRCRLHRDNYLEGTEWRPREVPGSSDEPSTFSGPAKLAAVKISNKELRSALASAVDEAGEDRRVAASTAKMTAEQRAASDANIKEWARWFDASRQSAVGREARRQRVKEAQGSSRRTPQP